MSHHRYAFAAVSLLIAAFTPPTAMAEPIRYGDVVGIFSESQPVRLDIGTDAMKENIPASHSSWATRLRIQRLDGRSEGPVDSNHIVGVFSEDGRVRLDIGARAMKRQISAGHRSWATLLRIRRLDGDNRGEVYYGDLVGIFSEDGNYRLDIGSRAVKEEVPASHNSWATRLFIRRQ